MESRVSPRPIAPPVLRQAAARTLNGFARPAFRSAHARYMAEALRLARLGEGWTSPNPMVGAVVVKGGRIVGRGCHRRLGAAHAEVEALHRAGARARGATLYVTLEPCTHTGRTPPCCEAILRAGIARVVAAMQDPNPITSGRGLARLRRSGVTVITGILAREAEQLNAPFCKAMRTGLPFAIAKIAQSLDGKIATATGESRWITSAASRRLAHRWRSRVDAILVGARTAIQDDPRLTVRGIAHRPDRPVRVIVDSRLQVPATAACFSRRSKAPAVVATTVRGGPKRAALVRRGVHVVSLPATRDGRVPLRPLFRWLVRHEIQSVLIEGGGEMVASALAEQLVDRIACFVAPVLIGGRGAPTSVGGTGIRRLSQAVRLADVTASRVGTDLCIEARVVYPSRR